MTSVVPRATTELVAVAWLKGVVGDIVATTVPRTPETGTPAWAATGFVTVRASSGNPHMYVPMRRPVVLFDCFATDGQSTKPPWSKANGLAAAIVEATYDHDTMQRLLNLPAGYGYPQARVKSAFIVQEPRRPVVPGAGEQSADIGSWAKVTGAIELHWVEVRT
ncbi:hypothetical protein [Streptomyces sp. NPDC096153]|uniref:hypothetical protein n=1 Tax=Streptomyces sp. NPDC096153 TaxID=3155548 RepID=UPI003332EA2B